VTEDRGATGGDWEIFGEFLRFLDKVLGRT
jgi:hypothetical protein